MMRTTAGTGEPLTQECKKSAEGSAQGSLSRPASHVNSGQPVALGKSHKEGAKAAAHPRYCFPPPQGYWYSDDGDSIQLSWLIAADRPLKQLVHLKKPFISHPQYFLGITCEDNRLDLDVVRLSEIVSAMKGEVAEFGRFSFLLQTP